MPLDAPVMSETPELHPDLGKTVGAVERSIDPMTVSGDGFSSALRSLGAFLCMRLSITWPMPLLQVACTLHGRTAPDFVLSQAVHLDGGYQPPCWRKPEVSVTDQRHLSSGLITLQRRPRSRKVAWQGRRAHLGEG